MLCISYIDVRYQISIILLVILFLLISGFFILKKDHILFDPMTMFSAYYYTVVLSGIYFVFTNFETSVVLSGTPISRRVIELFNYSLICFIVGYLATLLGYSCFRRKKDIKINLENNYQIPDSILNPVIAFFLLIGIINFTYNILINAEGNLFLYMKNISLRQYEYAEDGTTVGYLFAYIAMYLWFFKGLRKQAIPFIFFVFLIISGLMKASQARILQTIVYLISFVVIYYYIDVTRNKCVKNAKYICGFILFGVLGITIYFLRILSALNVSNKLNGLSIDVLWVAFLSNIGYFAIDKGNIPNIPILMKIIDSWANDIGFLYGQSLLKPFLGILPTCARPEILGYSLGATIKETWFLNIPGGGLPPTGIGEMYANFGMVGPLIGMFMFGAFCAWLYNLLLKTRSYWILVCYSQILTGFILIYAKGEIFNLSLWYILPISFTIIALKFIIYVSRSYMKNGAVQKYYEGP